MSQFVQSSGATLNNKVNLALPIKQAGMVIALDVVAMLIALFGSKFLPASVAGIFRDIVILAHLILGGVGAVFLRRILIGLKLSSVGTLVLYVVTIFICFPAQWIVLGSYILKGQKAMQSAGR
jgi:hypothetical protein